jgi:uncharacterized membrane protein
MRGPLNPMRLVVLIAAITLLLGVIQLGVVTIAFDKLGLSPRSAFILLFASLIGSGINLPLFTLRSDAPPRDAPPPAIRPLFGGSPLEFTGKTLITINLGGGVMPCAFSLYLLLHTPITLAETIVATALMTGLSYAASRPIARVGIGMPLLLAPAGAALLAVILDPGNSAPLAYVCGTLGVLIGADVLRLNNIRSMGVPIASIGGAGTFDGVFITGIVAVLLA